jgi:DNA-binding NarL/FixJ family response regulator
VGRVLICHGNPYVREGLAKVLRHRPIERVEAVADAAEAIASLPHLHPEVLLAELETPSGLSVLDLYRLLKGLEPALRPPIVICPPERLVPTITVPLIERGAGCIIAADAEPQEFLLLVAMAIRGAWPRYNVLDRDLRKTAGLVRRGMEPCARCGYQPEMLTRRQREIVQMVAGGRSNRLIARTLQLSEPTVKNHLHRVFLKLNVGNRAELVAEATRLGLIGTSSG